MQAAKKIIINMLLVTIFSFSFGTTFLFADEISEIREMTKKKLTTSSAHSRMKA